MTKSFHCLQTCKSETEDGVFPYKGLPKNRGSLTPTSDVGSDASWELFWELMEVGGQSWHLVSAAICDARGDHLSVCE